MLQQGSADVISVDSVGGSNAYRIARGVALLENNITVPGEA
jgi:hypothetical protein